jgi:hypothetical protein
MRLVPLLVLVMIATPAAAQRLGERTQAPQSMVSGLRRAPGEDDLQQQVAEAETHPLGSQANPIRVGGPDGERAYLARLRCSDGAAPRIGPRRDGGVDTYGTVTGTYRLDCTAGSAQLFFDIYHEEHVEDRAPAGMAIAPR